MKTAKFLMIAMSVFWAQFALAASVTVESPTAITIKGMTREMKDFIGICHLLREEISNWSYSTQRVSDCQVQDFNYQGTDFGTLVQLEQEVNGTNLKLTIKNLKPVDETDPVVLTWSVPNSEEGLVALRKLVKNYAEFDANKINLKKELLTNGLGRPVNDETFKQAYTEFSQQDPKNKKYLAAGLEIAAILGASTLSYYSGSETNNPNNRDWDYSGTDSWKKRVNGDAVRFDDNHFHTNRGHYYAGAVYYVAAREAGLDRLESLLVTFAASSFWEYASEYREVVSINDQINTTLGGFIIGESIHQIAKIFQKGPNTLSKRILTNIFGSPANMSRWVQSKATGQSYALNNLSDAEKDFWSKLDLYARISKLGDREVRQLGFEGEVVNIPMFEEPGRVRSLYIPDTVQSQLQMEYGRGVDIETFKMFSKITLAAIYEKNMGVDKSDNLKGYQFFVGPAMALEIDQKTIGSSSRAGGSDFRGVVHVLGGTADLVAYQNGFKIHAVIDIYGDFAMMRSWAFDSVAPAQYQPTSSTPGNCNGVQSVLCHEGYYYGRGFSQEAKVVVSNGKVEMGVGVKNTKTSMINGGSRFNESVSVNPEAQDQVTSVRGWVVYQLSRSLKIELGAEKVYRSGSAFGKGISTSEITKYGKLVYQYN